MWGIAKESSSGQCGKVSVNELKHITEKITPRKEITHTKQMTVVHLKKQNKTNPLC